MREMETSIFRDLNQLELIQNDFSLDAIRKAKRTLNEFLYKKLRTQAEDFDIFGMLELQKQQIYKDALRQIIVAYDIEEQLLNAVRGWDFAVLNTTLFDALFTNKDAKNECSEKVIAHISRGEYQKAEDTLVEYITNARERNVEQSYNYIDFTVEKVDIDLVHGLVAKDASNGLVKVYDKEEGIWLLPLEYFKKYNEVPDKLLELGFSRKLLESVANEEAKDE